MTDDRAEREARTKEDQEYGFRRFMAEPMTRLAVSMIPAGEQQDALQMLLKAAYEQGSKSGQGSLAGEMLMGILERKQKS